MPVACWRSVPLVFDRGLRLSRHRAESDHCDKRLHLLRIAHGVFLNRGGESGCHRQRCNVDTDVNCECGESRHVADAMHVDRVQLFGERILRQPPDGEIVVPHLQRIGRRGGTGEHWRQYEAVLAGVGIRRGRRTRPRRAERVHLRSEQCHLSHGLLKAQEKAREQATAVRETGGRSELTDTHCDSKR